MTGKCPKCGFGTSAGAHFCTSCGVSLATQSFESQSSILSLLIAGEYLSILSPWRISVDGAQRRISVKKLNWYAIGEDEKIVNISNLREVKIDDLLVGSNIFIKSFGTGTIGCYCIPQSDARKIRDILFP